MSSPAPHTVALIPGDWIGPETCAVAQRVIAAAGVDIAWEQVEIGDDGVTDAVLEACVRNGVVLKAKVDAQRVPGQLPPTVFLRKALGLWATVRPVRALPHCGARFPGIDVVVVRETSEDIYSGFEHEVTDGVFEGVKVTTEAACARIAQYAYDWALKNGRKKVSIVHKSNIMKKSDGLFLRTAQRIGREYVDRGIATDEVIVDALCMRLVKRPGDFDVMLTGNLFGDIVSDLCSGLAGGITASPSMSYGGNLLREGGIALFENPHGKAPELVGTGGSNPLPMIRTANQMLRHLGEHEAADRIRGAVMAALEAGLSTVDQGGRDGCAAVERAIVGRLEG
jgi:isocitrate dehydrogenase (NAD+)